MLLCDFILQIWLRKRNNKIKKTTSKMKHFHEGELSYLISPHFGNNLLPRNWLFKNLVNFVLHTITHFNKQSWFPWNKNVQFKTVNFLLCVAMWGFIHLFYVKENLVSHSSKKRILLVNLPSFESIKRTKVLVKESIRPMP